MAQLTINLNKSTDDLVTDLYQFPFLDGQTDITSEYDDACVVVIDLADRADVTAHQAQYLNTHPNVSGWQVTAHSLHNEH